MSFKSFSCQQCGHCCTDVPGAYTNSVQIEDIEIWEQAGRQDILDWVIRKESGLGTTLYYLWFDPETGLPAAGCPWLEPLADGRFSCRIHGVKPRHCRDWPLSPQDARDEGCPAAQPCGQRVISGAP